jgi:hypothetical protein
VTAADLPAVLATHRVKPRLIVGWARHPDQVQTAVSLLSRLEESELETVIREWVPKHRRVRGDPDPAMPRALFDAVLERSLAPLADALADPGQHGDWTRYADLASFSWSHQFGGSSWHILAMCPARWPELVAHPRLGSAVQHLLLDQAETAASAARAWALDGDRFTGDAPDAAREPVPALSDDLLRACLPALCCPELALLPKPGVTARVRFHHIAGRVRSNPRLAEIAAEQLQAAADECVRRGRLLSTPRNAEHEHQLIPLAEDLALLSANPTQLAKSCALLAALPHPAVVAAPSSTKLGRINRDLEQERPGLLLEFHQQHRRVKAFTALAGNPHTPRATVTDTLSSLHPAELTWISVPSSSRCT